MKQLKGKGLKDFLRQGATRPPMALAFLLQDVEDPVNVGAAFRIADACGASEILLTGETPCPPDQTIAGVGRGTHRRVPWRYTKYAADALAALRAQGYSTCAVEVTGNSVPYTEVTYPRKLCLIVGNEYHGVARRTLAECDIAIYIPMYGKIKSLNVHVALGIVAYHALHSRSGDNASPPDGRTEAPTSPHNCGGHREAPG
ncbi:MAG: tRNA methyltransferase [Chloroflexota bacterium]|nr:tRNA methyltransferase [Chloroflexota bacterium]